MEKTGLTGMIVFVLLLATLSPGCSAPAAVPAISVENAWGRSGTIYLLIKNTGRAPDQLLSASSEACAMVDIYETVTLDDGATTMSPITKPIEIPAGGQVELKSGGYHVMCMMRIAYPWTTGAKIDLTLEFEKSGQKTVPVELRDE